MHFTESELINTVIVIILVFVPLIAGIALIRAYIKFNIEKKVKLFESLKEQSSEMREELEKKHAELKANRKEIEQTMEDLATHNDELEQLQKKMMISDSEEKQEIHTKITDLLGEFNASNKNLTYELLDDNTIKIVVKTSKEADNKENEST